MDHIEELKRHAAERAVALVEDGMALGLGSGTTAELFIRALAPRLAAGQRLTGVASSGRSERVAREIGLPLVELDEVLDLAVDGADAVERGTLHAVKGRGGALTREKLVAAHARRFVLVADSRKLVERLADTQPELPIPVEVLEFGWRATRSRLSSLGDPLLRERDGAPFRTDNGNLILDLLPASLADPSELAVLIAAIPGVVEHGLFLNMASSAIIAGDDGIVELTHPEERPRTTEVPIPS